MASASTGGTPSCGWSDIGHLRERAGTMRPTDERFNTQVTLLSMSSLAREPEQGCEERRPGQALAWAQTLGWGQGSL